MSIINQALKKAQREQLLHEKPHKPYALHRAQPRPYPVRWFIGAGCIVILGVCMMLYGWLLSPLQQAEERQRPRIARQTSTPVLSQPAVPLPTTPEPVLTTPADPVVRPTPAPLSPAPAVTPGDSVATSPRRPPQPALLPLPASQIMASAAPLSPTPVPARARAQDLLQQATELQERGQLTQAMTLLQQAVAIDATLKEGYNKLGNLHYKQQAFRQALASFQKVLAIDPGDAKAHNNLGSTYLQLDMDEQARDVLHKAITLDPTYGLAYYNLACVYARKGDRTATVEYLKHAITIEPRARDWAQADDDFRRVRSTPAFRQLLGPAS
jgi:tetratricopeptide (TPR) repeat protein